MLHATRDMAATLENCKALLRPSGLLIANELTAKTAFLTLTFGLTEGWWLYDDAGLRIPGEAHEISASLPVYNPTLPCIYAPQRPQSGW